MFDGRCAGSWNATRRLPSNGCVAGCGPSRIYVFVNASRLRKMRICFETEAGTWQPGRRSAIESGGRELD